MEWGHNWGYGNVDFINQIEKTFGETVTLSDTYDKQLQFFRTLEETITLTDDMDQVRRDASGYNRLFGNVVAGDDRALTSFASASDQGTSYSAVNSASTDWDDA
jgi:hypothetical protein